jgi:hypothetical protein
MYKSKKTMVVLLIIILVVLGVLFFKAGNNKEMDCVNTITNSYGNGCDARLSIILYQKDVEDKLDIAKEIIKKCEENSFKTIKFSYDMRIPNELDVNVYLTEKDFEEGNKAFSFNYDHDGTGDPDKFNILEDKEHFTITLK